MTAAVNGLYSHTVDGILKATERKQIAEANPTLKLQFVTNPATRQTTVYGKAKGTKGKSANPARADAAYALVKVFAKFAQPKNGRFTVQGLGDKAVLKVGDKSYADGDSVTTSTLGIALMTGELTEKKK
jgi:hypothetical protein